jgi:hypothetical protein
MTTNIVVESRMATTEDSADLTEECDECGQQTPHDVSVEILTESRKRENAEFSREPYRVSECLECNTTTRLRMNNA